MADTPTFGRYAEMPVEQMTAEQQAGYRSLVDGPRGRLPGPYRVWVHNPALVHAVTPLGNHFTPGQSALSEREREITVLVTCGKWASAYPTNSHERRGKEVGLPPAVVDAIVAGRPAALTDKREAAVYDMALALANGRLIPQDLYDRAVEALGHEGITDVIVLMGYYTSVSLTMNFYAVPVSGGGTPRH
jgi:4-carboxymuconolactone decarboxylase